MDQRALQSFLVLAEALHFGRAADACHMSPSTLSRAIKQLETALGVRLFERDNRSVTLTSEGEVFRRYAREAVAPLELSGHLQQEESVPAEARLDRRWRGTLFPGGHGCRRRNRLGARERVG